jgi:hypothetical protein
MTLSFSGFPFFGIRFPSFTLRISDVGRGNHAINGPEF